MPALADTDLFVPSGAEQARLQRFPLARKGYDPDHVQAYLHKLAERIDELERELAEAQGERDAAIRRYTSAREEAYSQLAGRVSELLRNADTHAQRVRREAEQEAGQRVAEARQEAERIRADAEFEADRIRREGEDAMRSAVAEADRRLGGLESAREDVLHRLRVLGVGLADVVRRLEELTRQEEANPDSRQQRDEPAEPTPDAAARSGVVDLEEEDLLESSEGVNLIIPDLLGGEEEELEEQHDEGR